MSALKKNYLVKKRNVLNEIRANSMSLTELRFFSIYLSKIHKDKPEETRVVRFPLDDFHAIMQLRSRFNINHIQKITNSLLCKVVNVPNETTGGYTGFQLFKKCVVDKDSRGEWYIEIDAHDEALPLLFNYKNKYFTYEVSNVLPLKSPNQHRMYELLKQYQHIGWLVFSVDALREALGVKPHEYVDKKTGKPRWDNFKTCVLDPCQEALEKYTDIKFTYEPCGKLGRGGKILNLRFYIEKNNDHVGQLTLDKFITENRLDEGGDDDNIDIADNDNFISSAFIDDDDDEKESLYEEHLKFPAGACDYEFTNAEMQVLYNLVIKIVPYKTSRTATEIEIYNYLKRKYDELIWRNSHNEIKNRMGYIKKIIEADLDA